MTKMTKMTSSGSKNEIRPKNEACYHRIRPIEELTLVIKMYLFNYTFRQKLMTRAALQLGLV